MTTVSQPPTPPATFWQKLARLRIPDGQSLVWKLIDLERPPLIQIAAFALFMISFHFLFGWSWSLSFAMILSMYLHEAGHAVVFKLAGIRFIILLLFPLGAVATPISKEEDARSDLLHWNTVGWLLQAGLVVNVLLMVGALLLRPVLGQLQGEIGQELRIFSTNLIYVNGLLAVMNLIPVWTLDAGQFFKVIYNSLNERDDIRLTAILLGGALGTLIVMGGLLDFTNWAMVLVHLLERFGWFVFLIIFAFGVLNKQGHDDPINATSKQAMTPFQVFVQLVVYVLLVTLTLVIFAGGL